MRRGTPGEMRPVTLVVGCGEIGSAVAVGLHREGFAVVLIDEADPAWCRRGMAFTNAWYVGNAELDGEEAVFCASLRSIPTVLARHSAIAATTWSWPGVAEALSPVALVDTRLAAVRSSSTSTRARLPARAPIIGVGPHYVAGVDADLVVDDDRGLQALLQPGHGIEPVRAGNSGRFATSCRIGERVQQGQVVGALGVEPVRAPATGVLRGLTARGARVDAGVTLIEVDARGNPERCFGIEEGPREIAERVRERVAHAVQRKSGRD